ncbi:neuronal acetylcholine receptor subunit alpha-10-like [Argopecten irradians]|uniref:neuronal acetylcholine receptor subunit alpha-10-like n=1 Tax=Argopecten irradians TaxID=31199 RepID=UPI00371FDAD7
MKIRILFLVLPSVLLVVCPYLTIGATLDDIKNLEAQLFANYSTVPRPIYNQSETINVGLEVFLMSLIQLDAVLGSIDISIGATIKWTDLRLTWDPSSYGGLSTMTVDPSTIWTPGVFILSTADELDTITDSKFHAYISSDGNVTWTVGKLVLSSCEVDMAKFPVDTQICTIELMPWGYSAQEVSFYALSSTINLAYSNPNGEWDIDSTSVAALDTYQPHNAAMAVQLTLSRKSTYFIMSLILPMNILGFLTPFVFLLPISAGRISYALTMFLSLAVYMTIISDDVPPVSEPMAGITYYTFIAMICSSAAVLLTIVTLRSEAKEDLNDFPKLLVRVVKWLATRFNRKGRGAQIEDGSEGSKSKKPDKNETDLKITRDTVLKYTDIFLFIFSLFIFFLVNIIFIAVYFN